MVGGSYSGCRVKLNHVNKFLETFCCTWRSLHFGIWRHIFNSWFFLRFPKDCVLSNRSHYPTSWEPMVSLNVLYSQPRIFLETVQTMPVQTFMRHYWTIIKSRNTQTHIPKSVNLLLTSVIYSIIVSEKLIQDRDNKNYADRGLRTTKTFNIGDTVWIQCGTRIYNLDA